MNIKEVELDNGALESVVIELSAEEVCSVLAALDHAPCSEKLSNRVRLHIIKLYADIKTSLDICINRECGAGRE